MRKMILFVVLIIFLISSCSRQNPENLVGQGSNIPGDKLPPPPEQNAASDAGSGAASGKVIAGEVKEFHITAKQFQFDPATIEVKKGDKVRLIVTSMDVPHGFSIAEYGINERLDVGRPVTIEFTADKQGSFTAFCSVFCGSGHTNMKGKLIVK